MIRYFLTLLFVVVFSSSAFAVNLTDCIKYKKSIGALTLQNYQYRVYGQDHQQVIIFWDSQETQPTQEQCDALETEINAFLVNEGHKRNWSGNAIMCDMLRVMVAKTTTQKGDFLQRTQDAYDAYCP